MMGRHGKLKNTVYPHLTAFGRFYPRGVFSRILTTSFKRKEMIVDKNGMIPSVTNKKVDKRDLIKFLNYLLSQQQQEQRKVK